MKNTIQNCKRLLLVASLCAAAACGDDEGGGDTLDSGALDAATPDSGLPANIDGSIVPALDGAVVGPPVVPPTGTPAKYAVVTQVASGEETSSYVSVVDTLGTQKVSLDSAIQVLGRALAANEPGSGFVFVSTGGAPELTKYKLGQNNKLDKVGSISFQDKGVQSIGEYAGQLQILSATKAYYFDTRTAQVIVWDPTALTVKSTIDLKSLIIADATLTFTSTLAVRDGSRILIPAGWRSSNNQKVISEAAVVVLDTTTDTVNIVRDTRCGYVRDAVKAADGKVYLATEAWGSSVFRLNPDFAPKPCLLRLKADLSGFDEAYYKELNSFANAPTGSLMQSKDGKVYTRVLDEAKAGIGPMTSARALASLPVWKWAEVTLGDAPTVTLVADAPYSTGSLIVFDTRDRRFLAEIKEQGTDLLDLTIGIGAVAISTTGYTFAAVQLQ
jgi:hypothetical protein